MSDFFNCKEVSAKIDTDTAQKIEALAASDVQVRLALFQTTRTKAPTPLRSSGNAGCSGWKPSFTVFRRM